MGLDSAFSWAKEQRGKGRAQRERVERGDDHRNRDRDRKLLVQPAGNAGDECRRDEYRGQNERDGHDRPRNLFHGFESRLLRREALLDMMLDRFDDHDGVVHDQADSEHESEERERVDRKSQQREQHESADQRDRNGQQRDQRRAPTLKKDEDDNDNQQQRFPQRHRRSL